MDPYLFHHRVNRSRLVAASGADGGRSLGDSYRRGAPECGSRRRFLGSLMGRGHAVEVGIFPIDDPGDHREPPALRAWATLARPFRIGSSAQVRR